MMPWLALLVKSCAFSGANWYEWKGESAGKTPIIAATENKRNSRARTKMDHSRHWLP
jgi:hypothetical protein